MKKVIAPIMIVLIAICVICSYLLLILTSPMGLLLKIIIGIGLLALAGALISILVERLKEIEEEDDNDFSKY